jgi:hypothetical protein
MIHGPSQAKEGKRKMDHLLSKPLSLARFNLYTLGTRFDGARDGPGISTLPPRPRFYYPAGADPGGSLPAGVERSGRSSITRRATRAIARKIQADANTQRNT